MAWRVEDLVVVKGERLHACTVDFDGTPRVVPQIPAHALAVEAILIDGDAGVVLEMITGKILGEADTRAVGAAAHDAMVHLVSVSAEDRDRRGSIGELDGVVLEYVAVGETLG